MADPNKDVDQRPSAPLQRYAFIGLILLTGIALSFVLFALSRSLERSRAQGEFQEHAAMRAASLDKTVGSAVEVVHSIRRLYDASREVERSDFTAFTSVALANHPAIQALEWAPRVPSAQRDAYIESAHVDGFVSFQITERGPDEQLVPAGDRPEYYPVFFVEPFQGNERALGYDLASDAMRRQVLEQARDTDRPTASGPLQIIQDKEGQFGFLLVVPVYEKGKAHDSVQDRRMNLQGFALGSFRIGDLAEASFQGSPPETMELRIYDATDPGDERLLLLFRPGAGATAGLPTDKGQAGSPSGLQWRTVLEVAGRRWAVEFLATEGSYVWIPWLPWAVLLVGLFLTGMSGAFAYTLAGQATRVERLVALRTSALEASRKEIQERNAQLQALNKELEAFSYSASHDLRAPLRAIDGFSQALLEDYLGKLDAQGADHLQRVRNASQYMGQLIDDLLKLSRLTRVEMRRQAVDLSAMVRSVSENLRKQGPDRRVEFMIADGLVVQGDPALLQVAMENLLHNAWKFTSKHPAATVEFGAVQKDGGLAYFVRDDGAGFDMAYADKLFGAFQRLHGRNEFEGTGIGLATVQRIINRHGGRVWAESAVEKGATFYFTIGE